MFNLTKKLIRRGTVKKLFAVACAVLMAFTLVFIMSGAAWAQTITTGNMPWEEGLKRLHDSITGPVAMAISLIAIVAAGAALIFGGDMTGFMRTTVYIVLVLGIIMSASNLLSALYSGQSALVPFIR